MAPIKWKSTTVEGDFTAEFEALVSKYTKLKVESVAVINLEKNRLLLWYHTP